MKYLFMHKIKMSKNNLQIEIAANNFDMIMIAQLFHLYPDHSI